MRLLLCLVLIVMLIPVQANELIEYRNVVFYPNGTQSVFKDVLITNVTEKFGVSIVYAGRSFYVSSPGIYTFDLPLRPFGVSVNIGVEGQKVVYEIENRYDFTLNMNVIIVNTAGTPQCGDFCLNAVRDGENIRASFSVPPKGKAKLYIVPPVPGIFKVGKSYLIFSFVDTASVNVTKPVLVSIKKGYNNSTWFAEFLIHNYNDVDVYAQIKTWYEANGKRHNLSNYSVVIKPNSYWRTSNEIKCNNIPVFYVSCKAVNVTAWNVIVKPAYPADLSDPNKGLIYGMALVLGKTVVVDSSPPGGRERYGGGGVVVQPPTPLPQKPTPQKPTPEKPKPEKPQIRQPSSGSGGASTSETEKKHGKSSKLRFKIKIGKRTQKLNGGLQNHIENQSEQSEMSFVATVSTTITIPSMFLLLPFLRIRPDVVDRGTFKPEEIMMFGRVVYIPIKCELGNILPGGATLVVPDMELAREIHEYYDIPLRSAEAIAIALKCGGRVFLSDGRAYEVAVKLGLNAVIL